ncbi:MAG: helix-turn-helix transcriptional regulator [Bacteroidales bacterium]|nr:helix-turn-helix transcriptional regulator [Bacteroidales bacterium]
MDLVQLGKNISAKRRLLKLSQEDLSFEMNISVTALSRIEQGKSDISFNRLLQIAQILKVPVSALVQDDTSADFSKLSSDIAQIKADVAVIKEVVVV